MRSLNMAVAGAMLVQEALRQTGLFPEIPKVTTTGRDG
jgi:tRNA(Leu) C34 or U34 (ribose-2'-O)-methylase TrmL